MDVAPRPHIERHIANLRALAALHEGCDETYRDQITKAQERGESEELSIEDRIQIQFVRAQVLRRSGLHDEARQEIEEAQRIVERAIVSPLTRCSMFLQQAFCEQVEGNYYESNSLIDAALLIAQRDLDNNVIIESRGRALKAHNLYSIFTYSDASLNGTNNTINDAKGNAETALRILNEHDIDHHTQKTLLRLLSGITNHLGLDAQQVTYDRRLAMLEAQYPDTSR
jgi:tetratricopeptide (TPR) repeat protein